MGRSKIKRELVDLVENLKCSIRGVEDFSLDRNVVYDEWCNAVLISGSGSIYRKLEPVGKCDTEN